MEFPENQIFVNKILVSMLTLIITRDNIALAQITLSQTTDAVLGKPFSLTCTTTTLIKPAYFLHDTNGTIVGSCTPVTDLDSHCGSGVEYNLTQTVFDRKTSIMIPKAERSVHQDTWKCTYGKEQAKVSVNILTIPKNITMSGLASDILFKTDEGFEITVTCLCGCAYPKVTFGWQFIDNVTNEIVYSKNETGDVNPSVKCSDAVEHEYKGSILINKRESFLHTTMNPVRLKCIAYLQDMKYTTPLSTTSSGSIRFQNLNGKERNTLSGGAIAGIASGAIGVILVIVGIGLVVRWRCRTTQQHSANENPDTIQEPLERRPMESSVVASGHHAFRMSRLSVFFSHMGKGDKLKIKRTNPDGVTEEIEFEKARTHDDYDEPNVPHTHTMMVMSTLTEDASPHKVVHDYIATISCVK